MVILGGLEVLDGHGKTMGLVSCFIFSTKEQKEGENHTSYSTPPIDAFCTNPCPSTVVMAAAKDNKTSEYRMIPGPRVSRECFLG